MDQILQIIKAAAAEVYDPMAAANGTAPDNIKNMLHYKQTFIYPPLHNIVCRVTRQS